MCIFKVEIGDLLVKIDVKRMAATNQITKIIQDYIYIYIIYKYTALSHGRLYLKILEFETSAKETCQVIGGQMKPLSKHKNVMGIQNGTRRDSWISIWVLKSCGGKP